MQHQKNTKGGTIVRALDAFERVAATSSKDNTEKAMRGVIGLFNVASEANCNPADRDAVYELLNHMMTSLEKT